MRRPLPGDELVATPKMVDTRAITIHASAAEVWPWVVQIGQGRGGFYSYDWLENLLGLNIHSADRIIPEFQDLKVGDVVPLEPGGTGPPVAAIEPNRVLVLGGRVDSQAGKAYAVSKPDDYFYSTWVFYLDPIDEKTTRLIVRFRLDWKPSLKNTLAYRFVLEPVHFVMERKMLLGIKQRAEGFSGSRGR